MDFAELINAGGTFRALISLDETPQELVEEEEVQNVVEVQGKQPLLVLFQQNDSLLDEQSLLSSVEFVVLGEQELLTQDETLVDLGRELVEVTHCLVGIAHLQELLELLGSHQGRVLLRGFFDEELQSLLLEHLSVEESDLLVLLPENHRHHFFDHLVAHILSVQTERLCNQRLPVQLIVFSQHSKEVVHEDVEVPHLFLLLILSQVRNQGLQSLVLQQKTLEQFHYLQEELVRDEEIAGFVVLHLDILDVVPELPRLHQRGDFLAQLQILHLHLVFLQEDIVQ